MSHWPVLAIVALIVCASSACTNPTVDEVPVAERNEPEQPKGGDATSPGCEGITARGECIQGKATYCDLEGDRLRAFDCVGGDQKCVIDLARGAICQPLADDPNHVSDLRSPCWDTRINEIGFCTADGAAVYCDTTGDTPKTKSWNCAEEGLACRVSICAKGASCCGTPEEETDPEPEPVAEDECGDIDFSGTCDADLSGRYCLGGKLMDFTCYGGKTCQEFQCGVGAQCCDSGAPPINECTELGVDGICTEDGRVRYCIGSTDAGIVDYACDSGETCREDDCAQGAACCP